MQRQAGEQFGKAEAERDHVRAKSCFGATEKAQLQWRGLRLAAGLLGAGDERRSLGQERCAQGLCELLLRGAEHEQGTPRLGRAEGDAVGQHGRTTIDAVEAASELE